MGHGDVSIKRIIRFICILVLLFLLSSCSVVRMRGDVINVNRMIFKECDSDSRYKLVFSSYGMLDALRSHVSEKGIDPNKPYMIDILAEFLYHPKIKVIEIKELYNVSDETCSGTISQEEEDFSKDLE